ncbi:MAG: MFS transporter [Actinophytocola sp.]|uniref:MFS transporter n=1 Tax=Actinophytocola sp. TaxID=1872138 RepID=UPI00132949B8|nr:MFS transporter [Actinophytocola sp.]MPZ82089.1 MFS transporter [Actinophytocola sp.]
MNARGRFVALFVADVISVLGSRVSMLAIPWLVLVTTGSATKMGLVAGAEMLPYVVSGVLAAPLADRFGIRRTTIVTDAASALAMAGIAAAPQLGFGWLLVLVAIAGATRGLGDRVKHVMLRPLAEEAGIKVIRVTSAYEGFSRTAMLLGSAAGGLLIAWVGPLGAIWVDAASFAVCAFVVATLVTLPEDAFPKQAPETRESYVVALRGGFRILWNDRLLPSMIVMLFALNMFNQASIAVFIPIWVAEVIHSPEALGLLLGTFAAGAVLGSIVFTAIAPKLPMYQTFMLGALLGGAPRLLVLGLTHELVLVCTVAFLSGLAMAAVNPVIGAMLYERVPPELQTRAFGVCTAITFTGIPIGGVLGGLAVAGFGLNPAILVAGTLCLVMTAAPWLWSRSRRPVTEREAEQEPEPAAQVSDAQ